jgi:hypothetical protein
LSSPAPTEAARRLRWIVLAMMLGVAAFAAGAWAVSTESAAPADAVVWGLAAVAGGALLAGLALDAPAPPRKLASLALREACGLIGGALTLVTGEPVWCLAFGAASLAALALALRRVGEVPPAGLSARRDLR